MMSVVCVRNALVIAWFVEALPILPFCPLDKHSICQDFVCPCYSMANTGQMVIFGATGSIHLSTKQESLKKREKEKKKQKAWFPALWSFSTAVE
jgi:hypothetical protein